MITRLVAPFFRWLRVIQQIPNVTSGIGLSSLLRPALLQREAGFFSYQLSAISYQPCV